MSCGIIQVVEAQVKAQEDSMNDSKTKENKEPMDESNVDWSDFGDVWWKKYQTGLEKGIPSEIKGDKTADELMDYLFGGMGKR